MAVCSRAIACSLLCVLSSDAFRHRHQKKPRTKGLEVPQAPSISSCGAEVEEKQPFDLQDGFNDEDLVKYHNRTKVVAQGCPKPTPLGLQEGDVGEVDWLYTFGAPGVGSPRFMHATNEDGIFRGLRTWRTSNGWTDIVPIVTVAINTWHPRMDAEEIQCDEQPIAYEPDALTASWPYTLWTSISLHSQTGYHNVTKQRDCGMWSLYTHFCTYVSYRQPALAIEHVASLGWTLVGWGYYAGGWIGGSQHSYLLQHPETLECVLTFQGTQDRYDWMANLAFKAAAFCGYVDEDEGCGSPIGDCSTRHERGAFVHFGFAAHLRNIVQTESWQEGVHSKLSKCSAVYVTGHSLGGAAASLFTGCISRKLGPDDFGYDDYKLMSWTKGKPERLPTALPPSEEE